MTPDEYRVIGYLITHPNSKFPAICTGLRMRIDTTHKVLTALQESGKVKGRGYASHEEQYYVPDTESFLSPEALGRLHEQ